VLDSRREDIGCIIWLILQFNQKAMVKTIFKKSILSVLLASVVFISACNDNSTRNSTTKSDTAQAGTDTTNMSNSSNATQEPITNSQY
jgi:hypothetical protein